jgi:hypothetical protein
LRTPQTRQGMVIPKKRAKSMKMRGQAFGETPQLAVSSRPKALTATMYEPCAENFSFGGSAISLARSACATASIFSSILFFIFNHKVVYYYYLHSVGMYAPRP